MKHLYSFNENYEKNLLKQLEPYKYVTSLLKDLTLEKDENSSYNSIFF